MASTTLSTLSAALRTYRKGPAGSVAVTAFTVCCAYRSGRQRVLGQQ